MREDIAHACCTPDRDAAALAVTGRRSSFRVHLLDRRKLFHRKSSLVWLSRFYSWGLVQYGGRRMEILMTVRKIASICTMVGFIYFYLRGFSVAVSVRVSVCPCPLCVAGVLVQLTAREGKQLTRRETVAS